MGVFDVMRIVGMIVENWSLMDNIGPMQQLGVMAAPAEGDG